MVDPRVSWLGWFAVVLLGQLHGWAAGTSTCTSFTVSGVGDLDGTYQKSSSAIYNYFRATGLTTYEVYRYVSGDLASWYLEEAGTAKYRTYDPALHPADITNEWSECTSWLSCSAAAAVLQPVITCEGDDDTTEVPTSTSDDDSPSPTPPPTADVAPPTLAPTPGPSPSPSPGPTNVPSPSPTKSPVIAPTPDAAVPTTPSPSPIPSGGDVGISPIASPPPTTAGESEEGNDDDDDDGDDGGGGSGTDNTNEIVIGVVTTLISGAVAGAVKCVYDRFRPQPPNSGTSNSLP